MKELRRKDRAITEEEAVALLNKAEYGVLSTVTENGKPYKPGYHDPTGSLRQPVSFVVLEIN